MLFRDVITDVAFGQQNRSVLAFYVKRLARENFKRSLAVSLGFLVILLQIMMIVRPAAIAPEALASSNDLVIGGLRDKQQAVQAIADSESLRAVYDRLGIGEAELQGSQLGVQEDATGWMAAHNPHGEASHTAHLTIRGQAYYLYPAREQGLAGRQPVLIGRTRSGDDFLIVMASGNPVIKLDRRPDQIAQALGEPTDAAQHQLTYLLAATNLTVVDKNQQSTNAAGTRLRAGDEVRYTLTTRNASQAVYPDFRFEQNINDILEYADLVDAGGGELVVIEAASSPTQKVLRWPPTDIEGQRVANRSFTIRVKRPVSTVPTGQTDSASQDLRIDAYFGTSRITLDLEPPLAKRLEAFQMSLPQLDPRVVLGVFVVFVLGLGFVWRRNRLIRRELTIMATTGGHPK